MENQNHIELANILSHHKYILDSLPLKKFGYDTDEIFDDLKKKLVQFVITMQYNNGFSYPKFYEELTKNIKSTNQNIDNDYHTQ